MTERVTERQRQRVTETDRKTDRERERARERDNDLGNVKNVHFLFIYLELVACCFAFQQCFRFSALCIS